MRVCAGTRGGSFDLSPTQARSLFRGRMPVDIGFGSHACVYGSGNEVVKITAHESDVTAALAVSRHPIKGVLKVKGVARVGDYYYAIKSERVPAPGPVARLVQRCGSEGRIDHGFAERERSGARGPAPVPATVRSCIAKQAPRIGIDPRRAEAFARDLSAAQARLSNALGIHWFDIHSEGNISQDASGNAVIVDMGQSRVPAKWTQLLKRKTILRGW